MMPKRRCKSPASIALLSLIVMTLASPAWAIKGGRAVHDPDGVRRHVVQIKGPGGTQCSGTVVGRRLILTAAHCFLAGPGNYVVRALDPDFRFRFAKATAVAIHPDFDVRALGTAAPLNDIALLRLDGNLPGWLEPVPLASDLPTREDFIDVLAAGFGMNHDRVVRSAGKLRETHFAMLDKVYQPANLLFLVDRERKRGARVGICRGDSGGPVLRPTRQGYVLVGVISAVIAGQGTDCGSITAVTAVAPYRSFLSSMARRASPGGVRFE